MEAIDGVAITERLPADYRESDATGRVGQRLVEALAALHAVDWRAAGLEDFGRPEGFLDRQVERWSSQLERYRVRELRYHGELGEWLRENRPEPPPPTIMHGDFHADNALISATEPVEVRAIIDWEMATIGDPLLDLGIFLAFWGDERPSHPAMPRVQGFSRAAGAPSRRQLADHYTALTGRSVEAIDWYMVLAFWKLATIVEGAYAQFLAGELRSDYARELEQEVPRLLHEAAGFAGIS